MTETPEVPTTPTTVPTEPIKAPDLPYTFKASLAGYWQRIGKMRLVIAGLITFIFWFRWGPVVWLVSVIFLAIVIFTILYALSSRRVTLREDGFDYGGKFSRSRTIRYDQLEGAKVFINFYDAAFGMAPRVSLAVKEGSPINLTAIYWPLDELDKLIATLKQKNVPVEYYEDAVSYSAVAKQFPHYASYVERHTGFVALVSVIAILVVAGVIAFIITAN